MQVIFQVSNDGVAFRYRFPDSSPKLHRLKSEASSLQLPAGHGRVAAADVGRQDAAGKKSILPTKNSTRRRSPSARRRRRVPAGFIPALFRSGDVWLLVSEGSLARNYCGTRLRSTWREHASTRVGFPDPREGMNGGPVNPESTLPWHTPWRFIVVGTLKTIAESTLGIDLADQPPRRLTRRRPMPGQSVVELAAAGRRPDDVRRAEAFHRLRGRHGLAVLPGRRAVGQADRLREAAGAGRLCPQEEREDPRLVQLGRRLEHAPQTPRDRMLTHESRIARVRPAQGDGRRGTEGRFLRRRRPVDRSPTTTTFSTTRPRTASR